MLTVVAVAAFLPRAPSCSPAGCVCLGCGLRGRFSLIEWGIGGYFSVLLQKYREGLAVIERSLRQELIIQGGHVCGYCIRLLNEVPTPGILKQLGTKKV